MIHKFGSGAIRYFKTVAQKPVAKRLLKSRLLRKRRWIVVLVWVFIITSLLSVSIGKHANASVTMTMPDNGMPMVTATDPSSFTQKLVALPISGFTATASDQEANYPASNVLDGNSNTIWQSEYSPNELALPHSITIDMHKVGNVSGIQYLPRQDGSSHGNIGSYTISLSSDGVDWGSPVATGTWADDNTQKVAVFRGEMTRYVRLTALTEAGNRGPWTTAAEISLIGNPPIGPTLSRVGWTATADSMATGSSATLAIDGRGSTFWHSAYSGSTNPLPHSITIDMQKVQTVTGLDYMPRQDTMLYGTIGNYQVSLSTDGVNWGNPVATGTWTNDQTEKYAVFNPTSARYVKLTALSAADGPNDNYTTVAEINMNGVAPTTATGGEWGASIGFPLVPVSAVMLPNNKLLTFSALDAEHFDTDALAITKVSIMDLNTGIVEQSSDINTHHQMFCTGLALLPNGDVLINGGSSQQATTIYDPTTNTWSIGPLMNISRAYNSDTTTSNGDVFTIGGSWWQGAGDKNGELYVPNSGIGSWKNLPNVLASYILTADPAGIYRADNHAWLEAQANGTVFQAGPSKQMNWITTGGNGTITPAGDRSDSQDAMNGNAVLYDVGKILTVGGATAYEGTEATNRAYVVDISGGPSKPVITTRTGDMTYARSLSNSVVLPDGKVLVVGGQQFPEPFTDTSPVLSPELWDPTTGQFSVMAPETVPRTYHSVALLMPDGRVFSGGGGLCGTKCTTNHEDGQIFSPPYLFNADGSAATRPVINSAPTETTTGSTITVTTNSATPQFSLIRMGAATHSVDNDQRRIPLVPTVISGNTYSLQIPSDPGIVLPGNYMLFAMNANGVPSVSKVMNIQ